MPFAATTTRTFETLVNTLVAAYDVTQARGVAVANNRLQRLVTESGSLKAIMPITTTVAGTSSYTLPSNVVQVLKVRIGTATYEGSETLEDMWEADDGTGTIVGNFYVIEPDADSDITTTKLRLYPTPTTTGTTIEGLVVLEPGDLVYATATALPIPTDVYSALEAGCKADLSDDEGRQDQAQKFEQEFMAGVQKLRARVTKRGKGTGQHRMRVRGYDLRR